MNIDKQVNCMSCLVADDEGTLFSAVAKDGTIIHALARTAGTMQTAHHLCAFDASGMMKSGMYWTSRVEENDIIYTNR